MGVWQVQHELSVPAVSTILMSCGTWAMAVCTASLLAEAVPLQQVMLLQGLAAITSLVAAIFVSPPCFCPLSMGEDECRPSSLIQEQL